MNKIKINGSNVEYYTTSYRKGMINLKNFLTAPKLIGDNVSEFRKLVTSATNSPHLEHLKGESNQLKHINRRFNLFLEDNDHDEDNNFFSGLKFVTDIYDGVNGLDINTLNMQPEYDPGVWVLSESVRVRIGTRKYCVLEISNDKALLDKYLITQLVHIYERYVSLVDQLEEFRVLNGNGFLLEDDMDYPISDNEKCILFNVSIDFFDGGYCRHITEAKLSKVEKMLKEYLD